MALAVGAEDKRAMQDFQNLAQADKNCYDISELLLHATIRYISAEEAAFRVLLDREKKSPPVFQSGAAAPRGKFLADNEK